MAAVSMVGWISDRSFCPTACLTLLAGNPSRRISTSIRPPNLTRPGLLHCSFLPSSSSIYFPSTFSGLSLGLGFGSDVGVRRRGKGLMVRASNKAALCQTKRNRSRKSLSRTHGFRRRMRSTGGRAILQRRRAKGRKILCTKSYPNRGKAS